MYDSALRAQLVYAALKDAYTSKVEEQKRRETVGAAESLLETDLPEVTERLGAIGVNVQGTWQRASDEHTMEMPAEFRGVQVTVVLQAQLACNAVGNPIFIEMQARDFMSIENGDHSWTRALPFNERDVKGGVGRLDAISLNIKNNTSCLSPQNGRYLTQTSTDFPVQISR